MKILKLKSWIMTVLMAVVIAGGFVSCDNDEDNNSSLPTLNITGVIIPSVIDTYAGADVTITGKGFEVGDVLTFTSTDGTKLTTTVKSVTANTATFAVPAGINSGTYKFNVTRGEITESLMSLNVNIIANLDIPDVAGKNVKGVVYCNGIGIPNVVVSDGYEVTTTDADGIYYLASEKQNGYVFISTPSGYEAPLKNGIPQFFGYLIETKGVVEQKNFGLTQVDNTNHTILAMADLHLANRNNDIDQFQKGFLAEVKEMCGSASTKIYGLTLGDMTWDAYWKSNNYALPDYIKAVEDIGCPIFNTMGNHDNNAYIAGDWLAEQAYKTNVGPTYYSFNIGEIHYVVLDNVEYLNADGSEAQMGSRDYNSKIIADQIEWLKKDLAMITDKTTPVMVAMHCPLYNVSISGGNQAHSFSLSNGAELKTIFSEFSTVHYLSGHTHLNYNIDDNSQFEHNTAAVCATWWWTGKNGYSNNHISKDGTPGGYGVYEISGRDIKWYYKGIGMPKTKQFRTYDRNAILITADKYTPAANDGNKVIFETLYAGEYKTASTDNYVLINVWNYDPSWTIEVTEGGNALTVSRVSAKDPLHIISYTAKRFNIANATPTFPSNNTTHMFRVKATSATSTLSIKVTDRFGNVYTEEMARPKDLSTSMN